jgi:hypothetical protein
MVLESAVMFGVAGIVMHFAHQFADHVVGQNDHEAQNKAAPGRAGWSALLMHVWKYHIVMFGMLLATSVALNLPVTLLGFLSAIAFSAVTHAFLDRRWPVTWLLNNIGSPQFAKMTQPLHGGYLADQGLHYFCLWIAALLFALL